MHTAPSTMTRLLLGACLALAATLASAQTVSRPASGPQLTQVRHDQPRYHRPAPPPRYEAHPHARRGHAWVSGHWRWQGHRHVWIPGHWVKARRGPAHGHPHGHRR